MSIFQVQTLPRNSNALKPLRKGKESQQTDQIEDQIDQILEISDACVTLWNEAGKLKWYVGYCTKVIGHKLYEVEHVQQRGRNNMKWRYPQSLVFNL